MIVNNNNRWKKKSLTEFEYEGEIFKIYDKLTNMVIFNNKIYIGCMCKSTDDRFFLLEIDNVSNFESDKINIVLDSADYGINDYSNLGGINYEHSRNLTIWKDDLYLILAGENNENKRGIYLFKFVDGTNWDVQFILTETDDISYSEYYSYAMDIIGDENNLYICAACALIVYDSTDFNIYYTTNFPLPQLETDTQVYGTLGEDYFDKFIGAEIINGKVILICNFETLYWPVTRTAYDISKSIYYNDNERQFLVAFDPVTKNFTRYVDWKEWPYGQGTVNLIKFNDKLYVSECYWHWEYGYGKIWQIEEQMEPSETGPESIVLDCIIRDFNDTHPDFQSTTGIEPGIVESTLGTDKKPVWNFSHIPVTVTTKENFDQWYNDVDGVNMKTIFNMTLTKVGDVYKYSNMSFFPIDGQLFGNQGRTHNYHFTLELHSKFTYRGGETFTFSGDDDLWVFINNQLVIDLGGVHDMLTASVNLDTLGLTVGETYDFDLFFAERHTISSRFEITTGIQLIETAAGHATKIMEDFYWPNSYFPREEYSHMVKKTNVDNKLLFYAYKDAYSQNDKFYGNNLQVVARTTEWGDEQKNYAFDTILYDNSEISAETFLYDYPNNYYDYVISQPWTNSLFNIGFIDNDNNVIHSMISSHESWQVSSFCSANDKVYAFAIDPEESALLYTEPIDCEWTETNLGLNYKITACIEYSDELYLAGISSTNNNVILKCTDIRNIESITNLNDSAYFSDSTRISCFCIYDEDLYFSSGVLVYKLNGNTWELILDLTQDAPSEVWEGHDISSMAVYKDILYLGGVSLISYDSTNFTFYDPIMSFINDEQQGITSLCAYDDYLYLGLVNLNSYQGYLYEFDSTNFELRCTPAEYRLNNLDPEDTKSVPLMGPIVDMKTETLYNNEVLLILESHYKTNITRQNSRLLYCDTVHVYELGSFPRDVLSKIDRYGDDIILIGSSGGFESIWYCDFDDYILSNVFTGKQGYTNSVFGTFYDNLLTSYSFTISNNTDPDIFTVSCNICGIPPQITTIRVYPIPLENTIGYPTLRKYPIVH